MFSIPPYLKKTDVFVFHSQKYVFNRNLRSNPSMFLNQCVVKFLFVFLGRFLDEIQNLALYFCLWNGCCFVDWAADRWKTYCSTVVYSSFESRRSFDVSLSRRWVGTVVTVNHDYKILMYQFLISNKFNLPSHSICLGLEWSKVYRAFL